MARGWRSNTSPQNSCSPRGSAVSASPSRREESPSSARVTLRRMTSSAPEPSAQLSSAPHRKPSFPRLTDRPSSRASAPGLRISANAIAHKPRRVLVTTWSGRSTSPDPRSPSTTVRAAASPKRPHGSRNATLNLRPCSTRLSVSIAATRRHRLRQMTSVGSQRSLARSGDIPEHWRRRLDDRVLGNNGADAEAHATDAVTTSPRRLAVLKRVERNRERDEKPAIDIVKARLEFEHVAVADCSKYSLVPSDFAFRTLEHEVEWQPS